MAKGAKHKTEAFCYTFNKDFKKKGQKKKKRLCFKEDMIKGVFFGPTVQNVASSGVCANSGN